MPFKGPLGFSARSKEEPPVPRDQVAMAKHADFATTKGGLVTSLVAVIWLSLPLSDVT